MRILFLSPMPTKPTGGVRVIYNYVNILRSLGVDAYVLHPLRSYRYPFADEDTAIFLGDTIDSNDHIVIPDVFIGMANQIRLKGCVNYSLLIQNPYIIRTIQKYNCKKIINKTFSDARRVLCISEDTINVVSMLYPQAREKIDRVNWSLPAFSGLKLDYTLKENVITYMPRKNIDHVNLTLDCIEANLPNDWSLIPIKNMSRKELEDAMNKSKIFLTFGSFEGLPAPPVEAAIAGNYVIGYHGNGGREYWERPNFTEINPCDITTFASRILKTVEYVTENEQAFIELKPGIEKLSKRFSGDFELRCLQEFVDNISGHSISTQAKDIGRPFETNLVAYYLDRVLIKLGQISAGL